MTTELVSQRSAIVSFLLPSLCLRYGVAKPSVWLCKKACKRRQFNGFRSDYPLVLTCFWSRYWSVLEKWYVRTFLAPCSEGCRGVGNVSQSWSQSSANIAGSWNHVARGSQIRNRWRSSRYRGHPLTTAYCSEHAGRFPSPPRPRRVAARVCCLNLHRKPWLNLNTVARLTGAQAGHPSRTTCWLVRLTRVAGKRTTIELRDRKQATENEATSTVDAARLQSMQAECWCHRPQVHKERKEPIMHQSRGALSFTALFTTDDIGLRKDASVEHVVKVFLNVGEAIAARWIEMPRGILLLQAVPDQPASGAIYLYDRERHIFFFVDFVDGRNDSLTAAEFDQLVTEYDLVSWTANPAFLPVMTGNPAMA